MEINYRFKNISCAILAGGKNSRFHGENKAFLEIDGVKIIDRTLHVLRPLFEEIILITNTPEDYAEYTGVIVSIDIFKNIGPLGGIHSALSICSKDAVFIVACDMPFLSKSVITNLLDKFQTSDADIMLPVIRGQIEPLHAVYAKKNQSVLEDFLKTTRNFSIRAFFPLVKTAYSDIITGDSDKNAFMNINAEEDLEKY